MSDLKRLIFIFFSWRVMLFLPVCIATVLIPYRANSGFTNILFYKFDVYTKNLLVYPWANFDGVHYLSIAGNGYTSDGRFLPLYPLLVHFISAPFGFTAYSLGQFSIAFLISNVSFLTAVTLLYKLLRLDYNSQISFQAVLFLLLFPTSFFFVSVYAESLFFLLLVLSFIFLRYRWWIGASLLVLLLCITRPVGICMIPVLLFEFFRTEKLPNLGKVSWGWIISLVSILLTPLGLLGYGIYNKYKWGDPLYFIHAQGDLSNGRSSNAIVLFPQTIFRYIKILLTTNLHQFEWWVALLEFSVFFLALVMLYIAWKKKVRASYLIFSLIAFLVPASTGTFSGLPRYVLVLFPVFITIALIKNTLYKYLYVILSLPLLFLLLMFFSRGYYIA